MNNSIVIFASGDVGKLVQRLKVGTPNLELIEGDIVTEEIQAQMKDLAPDRFDYNLPIRRERLSNELMQGLTKAEIIVIDTKKSRSYLDVYKKSGDAYNERITVINLTVRNGNAADHSKEVCLVKGEHYKSLVGILTKGCFPYPVVLPESSEEEKTDGPKEEVNPKKLPLFVSIEPQSIEELEDTAISEVNKSDLSLLCIDTKVADDESRVFLRRLSERRAFAVLDIESTEEITIEPEEPEVLKHQDELVTDVTTSTKEMSTSEATPLVEDLSIQDMIKNFFRRKFGKKKNPVSVAEEKDAITTHAERVMQVRGGDGGITNVAVQKKLQEAKNTLAATKPEEKKVV